MEQPNEQLIQAINAMTREMRQVRTGLAAVAATAISIAVMVAMFEGIFAEPPSGYATWVTIMIAIILGSAVGHAIEK